MNDILFTPIRLSEFEKLIEQSVERVLRKYLNKETDTLDKILSLRALQVIKNIDISIITVFELVNLYKSRNDKYLFLKQRNCGKKTNKELMDLISKNYLIC